MNLQTNNFPPYSSSPCKCQMPFPLFSSPLFFFPLLLFVLLLLPCRSRSSAGCKVKILPKIPRKYPILHPKPKLGVDEALILCLYYQQGPKAGEGILACCIWQHLTHPRQCSGRHPEAGRLPRAQVSFKKGEFEHLGEITK